MGTTYSKRKNNLLNDFLNKPFYPHPNKNVRSKAPDVTIKDESVKTSFLTISPILTKSFFQKSNLDVPKALTKKIQNLKILGTQKLHLKMI